LLRRGELTGLWVAVVSHRVAHCLERLTFGSIWLQSHLLKYFWSHDVLLWNAEEDDHKKKWEVLKII